MTLETNSFLYCVGLKGFDEVIVSDGIIIRDASIDAQIEELTSRSENQFQYGLLCSLAPYFSFEVEFSSELGSNLASTIWNFQWELSYLSILTGVPVYWPFTGKISLNSSTTPNFSICNAFFNPAAIGIEHQLEDAELDEYLKGRESFMRLLEQNAFSHASSILAIHSYNPNMSIAMSTVWSGIEALLGFEHELRFRISLALTVVLVEDESAKPKEIRRFQQLYDQRSKCVHGAKLPKNLDSSLQESKKILRDLIRVVVQRGRLFERNDWEKAFTAGSLLSNDDF